MGACGHQPVDSTRAAMGACGHQPVDSTIRVTEEVRVLRRQGWRLLADQRRCVERWDDDAHDRFGSRGPLVAHPAILAQNPHRVQTVRCRRQGRLASEASTVAVDAAGARSVSSVGTRSGSCRAPALLQGPGSCGVVGLAVSGAAGCEVGPRAGGVRVDVSQRGWRAS